MGEVWRATDTSLGRPVAVKVLKSEYADDPLFRSRFETEAQHAASLHHPGVASVYDVGESAALGAADGSGLPRPFLVMELVDGQPLSALLRGGQPLDPDAVRDLMAQAADAIGAAHRAGIVHRDVKPANLLVTPSRQVKITDFGIARATDGLGLTATGQVMGTPQYLSPEQARGATATSASDVYSLGVVAFECLAGHRPFDADSPVATALAHLNDPVPDLPPDVPRDLAAVVRRAMAKDPGERFADGDAFAAALRDPASATDTAAETAYVPMPVPDVPSEHTQVLNVPPQPAPVPSPTPVADPRPPTDERRSPWLVVLLVLALVAAIVLIIVVATRGDDDGNDDPRGLRHQQRADVVRAHDRGHPDRGDERRARRGADQRGRLPRPQRRRRRDRAARQGARGRHPADRQPGRRGGRLGRVGAPDHRPGRGRHGHRRVLPGARADLRAADQRAHVGSAVQRAHLGAAVVDCLRHGHRDPDHVRPGRARLQIDRCRMSETPPEPPVNPPTSPPPPPVVPPTSPPGGGLVGGRYELGELLGRGGMAEVRKGHDTRLGRVVAIKRLRTDLASDATFQARFRREAQSAASLNHPAIVAVYDTGEEPASDGSGVSQPYIVMEFVAGRTLRDILRDGRKILPERALEITSGVLSALDYSHRAGIIHRDIKPGNVMLTPSGDVKVMDFGIARAMSDSNTMTQTAAVVGTAQYLSPEQARGETVDSRSDVYSSGCLLYELLTGRPPFVGDSPVAVAYQHVREPARPPSDHDTDLTPAVDAIVMKALAKRLEDRYQSAAAMRSDIERYLAGRPVQAPVAVASPPAPPEPSTTDTSTSMRPPLPPADVFDERDDYDRGRGGPRALVLVLLGLLILALLAGGYVLFKSDLFESAPKQVQIPNVIGMQEDEARDAIGDAGLTVDAPDFVDDEEAVEGEVIDQDPNRDQYVDPGTSVHLTISSGLPMVDVPSLVGATQDEARNQNRLNLPVRRTAIAGQSTTYVVGHSGLGVRMLAQSLRHR